MHWEQPRAALSSCRIPRGGQGLANRPSPKLLWKFSFSCFAVPLLKFDCLNQMKIYYGAPRPALPEDFAPDDELPDAALERPMAAPTRRCSSGVSCRM